MRTAAFDLTRTNARIYADDAALVNVFRRLKRNLPTGYGDIHITVEVFGHFGKFIRTNVRERAIVDRRAPSFIGVVNNVTQSQETEVQARGY